MKSHAQPSAPLLRKEWDSEVKLDALLANADLHVPALKVSWSPRLRADAARVAASPLLPGYPQLTVWAGRPQGRGASAINLNLSLTQQLQLAVERRRERYAADRLADSTEAEIERVRWAVHCNVHEAFHRKVVERERTPLDERILAFRTTVLGGVERQVEAGEAAPLSLRLAQAEVAQAQHGVVAASLALRGSRIQIAQLAGWPLVALPNPAGGVDLPRELPGVGHFLTGACDRLPGLRCRAAQGREARAMLAAAKQQAWPKQTLGLQCKQEGSGPFGQLARSIKGSGALPNPSFQINQGGQARARSELMVARAAQLEAAHNVPRSQILKAQ